MNRTHVASVIALVVAAGGARAAAHHSFSAEYDEKKTIKLQGRLTEMRWANPHAWIYLDVAGPDGKVVNWAIETGAANTLYRRGWRKEDLPHGATITVDGWLARNGSNTANALSITLPGGRQLLAGTSNPNVKGK